MSRLSDPQVTALLRERTLTRSLMTNLASSRARGQPVDTKLAKDRFERLCIIQALLTEHYAAKGGLQGQMEAEAKGQAEIVEKMKLILEDTGPEAKETQESKSSANKQSTNENISSTEAVPKTVTDKAVPESATKSTLEPDNNKPNENASPNLVTEASNKTLTPPTSTTGNSTQSDEEIQFIKSVSGSTTKSPYPVSDSNKPNSNVAPNIVAKPRPPPQPVPFDPTQSWWSYFKSTNSVTKVVSNPKPTNPFRSTSKPESSPLASLITNNNSTSSSSSQPDQGTITSAFPASTKTNRKSVNPDEPNYNFSPHLLVKNRPIPAPVPVPISTPSPAPVPAPSPAPSPAQPSPPPAIPEDKNPTTINDLKSTASKCPTPTPTELTPESPTPPQSPPNFKTLTHRLTSLPSGCALEEFFYQFPDILRREADNRASCLACKGRTMAANTGHIRTHFKSKAHLEVLEAAEAGLSLEVLRSLQRVKDPDAFSLLEDNATILCNYCKSTFTSYRGDTLNAHLKSKNHLEAVEIRAKADQDEDSSQVNPVIDSLAQEEFHHQFVQQLLIRNIALRRVDLHKDKLKSTFKRPILSETTYRKMYLSKVYKRVHGQVLEYLRAFGSRLYMILHQRADSQKRPFTILMIGTLEESGPGKVFVVDVYESPESESVPGITQVIDDAMNAIFQQQTDDDDEAVESADSGFEDRLLLLLTTDSSTTIKQAARSLQKKYRKMIHLTCLLSGLRPIVGLQLPHLELYLEQLEEPRLKLIHSLNIVELIRYKLMDYPQFQKRVNAFLEANPGFAILESIARMKGQVDFGTLKLSRSRISGIPEITVDDLPYYTHIPLVGSEASRAFTQYECLFSGFRSHLNIEALRGYLIVGWNSPLLTETAPDNYREATAAFDELSIWEEITQEELDEDGEPVKKKRRKRVTKAEEIPSDEPEIEQSEATSNEEVEDALHFLDQIDA